MTDPVIEPLGDADVADVVAYVVAAQADPTRHVTFVGDSPVSVRADLAAAESWRERTLVGRGPGGAVTGVLTVDVDEDMGRLWWLGPWADDRDTTSALLEAGGDIAPEITQREFAPDARNVALADLAQALGYRAEEPSAVLRADLAGGLPDDASAARTGAVRPMEPDDRDVVARLHDATFPGTHTRGGTLVRDDDTRVLVVDDPPIGYVATQVQADGQVYVDFVGVDPAARGRGLGRTLVVAAMAEAAATGAPEAFLTVRTDNTVARALYRSLGFVEERIIAPYRRGFTPGA